MPTTDENKAIRSQQSRQVAQDAAEAYRAAKAELLAKLEANANQTAALEFEPLTRPEYERRRRELRKQARELNAEARNFGIERTEAAAMLGVSRMTIHEWLNEDPRLIDPSLGANARESQT